MLINDIKSILSGAESAIYTGFMPDSPDNVCVINATGGYLPDRALDGNAAVERPTFQVLIRDISYAGGDARINAVVSVLDGYSGVVNGTRYIHIFRQSDALPLGRDDKGRSMFSVNFYAKVERSG